MKKEKIFVTPISDTWFMFRTHKHLPRLNNNTDSLCEKWAEASTHFLEHIADRLAPSVVIREVQVRATHTHRSDCDWKDWQHEVFVRMCAPVRMRDVAGGCVRKSSRQFLTRLAYTSVPVIQPYCPEIFTQKECTYMFIKRLVWEYS